MKKGKYDPLFTPFRIGSVTVKNRIVMCAMGGTALIENGRFNENVREFFLTRAKAGVGLIIPGLSLVTDKWGRGGWLDEAEDAFLGPMKEFVDEIHQYDTKIFFQIGAGMGRGVRANYAITLPDFNYHNAMVAPSDGLPNAFCPEMLHRGLHRDEIKKIVDVFVNSAELAQKAGIDGIEIHAVHEGYLLDQFAISSLNFRTDEYGGSLENRLRFTTEIIQGIKDRCGADYPVIVRYSVASKMRGLNKGALPGEAYEEYGRSLEESPAVARLLESAGCDALDVDNGSYDAWYWAHPPVYMPYGCNLPEAAYLKYFVNIPIICSGRMEDPDTALNAIVNEQVDGIGIARQLLADPEWCLKIKNEDLKNIRPCIACHNGCFGRLTSGKNVSCAINPVALQEDTYRITPAQKKKHVVVVGGGIGGMEAARVCALRGHHVSLYEKTDQLGGVFIAAAAPSFKEADKKLINWYTEQISKLNIDVYLNEELTTEKLNNIQADAVIIATGARERTLDIPGADSDKVISAVDFLLDRKTVGDSIAVIGGGLTGCEIACILGEKGKQVTILEIQEDILKVPGLCKANSDMLREMIRYLNIRVMTGARVNEITGDGVTIQVNGQDEVLAVDTVITSIGYTSSNETLKIKDGIPVYTIGDAAEVGNLLSTVWSAYDAALAI
jgi:2-enoate reductase